MEEEKAISELFLTIMGDYSDSVIPPLSYFCPLSQTINNKTRTRTRTRDRDRDREQLRRQKVAELFKVLQTMVPNLCSKKNLTDSNFLPQHTSTQGTIVWETIHYITELEQKLMRLQAKREASAAAVLAHSCTHQKSSVEVMVSGNIAFFGIETVMQKGLAVRALMVLEQHQAEVLASNITTNEHKLTLTITAILKKDDEDEIQRIRKDLLLLLS
ncbi:hypothetical protein NE237_011353 [Protea cynaroides]|uniref:BHLH domain-containing protein n=1 Tax=Protea cynaroides TaxID=273540 RepID=A0A9Q0GVZ0_9MAGN|nr:hypothetical protein NE237_011353 [Protea cynaroides]